MASMLDMSLDDIVKESRGNIKKKGKGNAASGAFTEGAPQGQIGRRNTAAGRRATANDNGFHVGIDRSVPNTYIQGNNFKRNFRTSNTFNRLNNSRFSRGRGFQNGGQGNRPVRRMRNRAQNIVKVSNLDYSVMEEDLMELFSSVGDVVKVWIDYDRTDRSEGTGGCVFRTHEAARRSIQSYNGCRIEGTPIHLEMLSNDVATPRGPLNCPW